MPKRQSTYRVKSEAVQGKGSWVELRYMTWGEVRAAMSGEYETDRILVDHLVGWNWVDENGESLPLNPDNLYETERTFLLDALFKPDEAELKN